jgi:hypothetical protein
MPAIMFRPSPVEQEPKRKNRFVLEFPTELGIDSFNVQTSGKPKLEIGSTEIQYMNSSTWVAGRAKWSTIDIEFIDVIGPSTTQKIHEWMSLHFEPATGKMGYAIGYKKNLVLKALDPLGVEIEKWTLVGCMITNFDTDSFDYGSDDIIKVKITVQPDKCLLSA